MSILLILFLAFSAGLFSMVIIQAKRLSAPAPADCIIVLGAQVHEDGTPSAALERRLSLAASLYHEGMAGTIITTGAQGDNEPMPEALAMQNYLSEEKDVPTEHILAEPDSYNTVENIGNAAAIMESIGAKSAIVVTSDYHLWRALTIAKSFGIEATGAGSKNAITRRMTVQNWAQETLSWMKYLVTR